METAEAWIRGFEGWTHEWKDEQALFEMCHWIGGRMFFKEKPEPTSEQTLELMAALKIVEFDENDALHYSDYDDVPMDRVHGEAIAWCIGTLGFPGWREPEISAVDQWTAVAKALRVHGMKIVANDSRVPATFEGMVME